MNKLVSFGGAVALALALSFTAASPSSADDAGAAIAGGVLGFMAGAAVGSGVGPVYHYRDSDFGRWRAYGGRWGFRDDFGWRRHVRACFRAYGDAYSPRIDAYETRSGRMRRCRL
jgi:hypothetical protein